MSESNQPWRTRAALAAAEIERKIRSSCNEIAPCRDPSGAGLPHALFLAVELQRQGGEVDSDTKACRWLGYLQAMLVYEGLSELAAEKRRNLRAGGVPA